MAEPFVGQIMMGGFGFAPRSFALCNGQILAINQNQALFSLLGTAYGGNGTTTFALPNLQGRTPVAFGESADPSWRPPAYGIGEVGGTETVTLNSQQIPAHTHIGNGATADGKERNPEGKLFGTTSVPIYAQTGGAQVLLSPQSVVPTGGGQPHSNVQPYNVINFFIALSGIYPSRN
ncbi:MULTISPECIES: tail fiber protein [unclassified Ensifer]|uniref:phage tail protein n=1 Tax=unclassified Ensifer TaxID=2633371 RepID=UPI00070D9F49|nr:MULTISPECIES: tail fiber protein [unclassified Ensifer]KQY78977.1 microcystin-dependent protein [Ensifer sp. Root142]OMQ39798.1 microcystin-dependent protein [Ensifer sp. 1H6]